MSRTIKKTPKIFISYRRADSLVWVELLRHKLVEKFGVGNVFVDIKEIDLGDDFARIIEQRIGSCNILLAIIGPNWLSVVDENGQRRIERPDDYVRHEIAVALSRKIEVIPIFVASARPPKRNDLPQDIADLAERSGYELRDSHLHQDMDWLIDQLVPPPPFPRPDIVLKLQRAAFVVIPASVLVMFFAFVVDLFDKLTLDTQIETYTIWLGDWFKREQSEDKVVIVAITPDTEIHLKKPFDPSWREQHAQLVEALSGSGVEALLFDMVLRKPAPGFDEKLIAAIESARSKGTAVFFATDGAPSPIPGLEQAVTGLGHACIGRKVGYARTLPLVVAKREDRSLLPSLALLGAYPQGSPEFVDSPDNRGKGSCATPRYIQVRTAQGLQSIDYYLYEQISGPHQACPAIYEGDCVAEVIMDFRPLAVLRDPIRYYRYEDIVDKLAPFRDARLKGKIAVVGQVTEKDWIDVLYGFEKGRREGFEVHADAINTLLQGKTLRPLGDWNQFLIMLVIGTLGAWPCFHPPLAPSGRRRAYCVAVMGIYLCACIVLYIDYRILLNTAYHIGAFFMTYWAMGKVARRMGIWESNKIPASQG